MQRALPFATLLLLACGQSIEDADLLTMAEDSGISMTQRPAPSSLKREQHVDLGEVIHVASAGAVFLQGCNPDALPERDGVCRDDETPAHEVRLTRNLRVMQAEVTQGQYERMMGHNPSRNRSCGSDCPVTHVSWREALDFADAVSLADGLTPCTRTDDPYACEGWRLPTESEWEYLARGDEDHAYAGEDAYGLVAWHRGNTSSPQPVCTKQTNGFDLCDMSGNVWEWVWDRYDTDWYSSAEFTSRDPLSTATGMKAVQRGGSFRRLGRKNAARDPRLYLRVADRGHAKITHGADDRGFRLVRTVQPTHGRVRLSVQGGEDFDVTGEHADAAPLDAETPWTLDIDLDLDAEPERVYGRQTYTMQQQDGLVLSDGITTLYASTYEVSYTPYIAGWGAEFTVRAHHEDGDILAQWVGPLLAELFAPVELDLAFALSQENAESARLLLYERDVFLAEQEMVHAEMFPID